MKHLVRQIAALLATASLCALAVAGPVVLSESFEAGSRSCVREQLEGKPSATIGSFGRDSSGVRVRYMGMDLGSERTVFSCPLPEKGLEYTLTYDVKFEKDFQFVKGGKLHGLGPDRVMSGGDGIVPEGWSARVAFRKDGGVETYVYNQGQRGDYGQIDRAQDFKFETGRFYKVSLYVKLNSSAAASDGIVRLWIDGKQLVERTNIRYRAVDGDKALISRVLFSTFHGGGTPEWAPKDASGKFTSVYADFDNFVVSKGAP